MNNQEFKEAIFEVIRSKLKLNNPVVEQLVTSHSTNKNLFVFSLQQNYFLIDDYLTSAQYIYDHCPIEPFKTQLRHTLYNERYGTLFRIKSYIRHFRQVLNNNGGGSDRDRRVRPLDAMVDLLEYRKSVRLDVDRYHIGYAVLYLVSENMGLSLLNRTMYLAHFQGVELTREQIYFFTKFQRENGAATIQTLALLTEICRTPRKKREVLDAIDHACSLYHRVYASCHREFHLFGEQLALVK